VILYQNATKLMVFYRKRKRRQCWCRTCTTD